nr:hypothetical protein Q903MT_gene1710 [Picea sitchensis]
MDRNQSLKKQQPRIPVIDPGGLEMQMIHEVCSMLICYSSPLTAPLVALSLLLCCKG